MNYTFNILPGDIHSQSTGSLVIYPKLLEGTNGSIILLLDNWKWKSLSCVRLCDLMDYNTVLGILQATILEYGSLSLLQGIFPTQGLNPGIPHCRWILYQLSHKGSPRKLDWVAYPFSKGSSWPKNWTGVSCTAGRFFTNWAMREAH